MNSILLNRKTRVENWTESRVGEDSSLSPEILTKTAAQEFHLGIGTGDQCKVVFAGLLLE